MHFTKMQGLGNDYLYVYGVPPKNAGELSRRLSDRHFGAGADGMIYISPSEKADYLMRIFNADGSEAMMCGNGIRCVGKYVYEKGYTDSTRLRVETLSGVKEVFLDVKVGKVRSVCVEMGKAVFGETRTVTTPAGTVTGTGVSVGNPHFVILPGKTDDDTLMKMGPLLERHPSFPGGVNVEFAEKTGRDIIRMRVWERGSGPTLACGTGACAAVACAVKEGLFSPGMPVRVLLDGGELTVSVTGNSTVTMSGPAEFVYEGETDIC